MENGWAYGPGGTSLSGKFMMQAVSTGGSGEAYQAEGRNRFTVDRLLVPFNQTAYLCGMAYLEAFAIHAGRRMAPSDLAAQAEAYRDLIIGLRDGRINPLAMLAPDYRLPPAFDTRAA